MSEKEHKRHNHYHFGFFLVAAVAMCFIFAFSGERAAQDADAGRGGAATISTARSIFQTILDHWWVVPLALLPFWVIHFIYAEWRFLKHVYHVILIGVAVGFFVLYFQLDKQLFSFIP
ncbi:MAG: hypothetical protein ACYTFG_05795 [Planctomycetota bacterium]|jgi:hypothetical protein